jgi:hypothetical protein
VLENLFKTWAILAPDEVTFWDNGEAITLQKNQPPCHTWVTVKPCLDELDALLGYIQRCIEARKWSFNLLSDLDSDYPRRGFAAEIYQIGVEVHGKAIADSLNLALLTAYLSALAARRPVTEGRWQHFKGGEINVGYSAKWNGRTIDSSSLASCFMVEEVEECSDDKTQPVLCLKDESWSYRASKDHGDRVFYIHGNQRRAKCKESFLALVGFEYPESRGLLRYVKLPD